MLVIDVVTIDGPSGSGKSTVSKLLAQRLGYRYLDTGAMYRAFAFFAIERGLQREKERHPDLLAAFEIHFIHEGGGQRVICGGQDVTNEIRMPDVGMWASTLSAEQPVRQKMGALQRAMGEKGALVAEGRDMGTVVFADAFAKFYMIASPTVRAERRYRELSEKGIHTTVNEVLDEIVRRDEQDSSREIAPLRPASDAELIDTSSQTIAQVVDHIYGIVTERKKQWKF